MDYAETEPQYKKYKYGGLNLSLTEGFDRNDLLAISYTCVSCGKGSLFEKMQGSYEEKFDRTKLFYSYMMFHSGKKMTFMGCEIGERAAWNGKEPVEWFLLDYESHAKFQYYTASLNHFYLSCPALWQRDNSWDGFAWIDPDDRERSLLSYRRIDREGNEVIVVLNFTPVVHRDFWLRVPTPGTYEEIFNSDEPRFGGEGRIVPGQTFTPEVIDEDGARAAYVRLYLPARTALVLRHMR